MKDQYVGDIGDFEKYSVLRALQHASRLPLVVCWMLTSPDATSEGGNTAYLSKPERYRHLDPHIFDALEELVRRDRRSTAAVEAAGVLGRAVFIRDQLGDDIDSRRTLFEAVARAAGESPSLVFFDPDIGIAGTIMRKGAKRSSMYLFHDEAAVLFDAGHSLVIYQHFAREQRPEFLARAFSRMRAACEPAEHFALYSGRVAFLAAPHVDVAGAMRAAAEHLATHWKGLLSFAAEGDPVQAPDGHGGREIVLNVDG